MNALRVPAVPLFALFTSLPLFLSPTSSRAQDVRSGDRVRVEYAGGKVDGNLVSMDDDVVVVEANGNSNPSTIRKSSITDFERLDGKDRNWEYGLLIGAATGAAVGGIVAATTEPDPDEFNIDMDGFMVAGYAVLGAAAGTVVGLLIQTDRWTNVPLDDGVRLGLEPSMNRGFALSLTYDF